MGARAEAAERTAQRIFAAAEALFRGQSFEEVTLQAIADHAGVTLQTVLRRFGSKEALFEAASRSAAQRIFASRLPESSDHRSAVEALIASYEEMGDLGWRGLVQEERFPPVKSIMDDARARHRGWVETVFADLLGVRRGPERERRVMLLFGATDYYLWKLWRRDLGKSRAETTQRMMDLVDALARQLERGR
ncbi:MAG: TetR/AcrR family transcriptional regulator [Myxococcales bacterium]|nr:TetR/AcrR family transcriptional regulator [Myxococcales bacterium]